MGYLSTAAILNLKAMSKPGLAIAGLAIVALLFILERMGVRSRKVRIAVTLLLTGAGLIGVASYLEWGKFGHGWYMNPHDVFHYYMGSKYSREVGYSHLYASAIVADSQGNRFYNVNRTFRSQEDYKFVPAKRVLQDAEKYEGLFSPERWREFKRDVVNFQSRMPKQKLNGIVRDKGYNATPVWNMVARALSNTFDTDQQTSVNVLLVMDLAMLAAMLVMVWAAFGWQIAMLAAVFCASNFFMSYGHIRGAFLRLDWVALLVMSVCAIKLNWYKTAGAMMAYASLARVFPAIFVFGIGARFLWDIIGKRRLNRKYIAFFATFAVTAALLVALSILDDGGLSLWREFRAKITLHNSDLAPVRVGFKYIFLGASEAGANWAQFEAENLREFADRRVLWLSIQAVVLGVCFLASRKLRDYEALALGYVPVYFLVAPTFYYHVMLIVPFMFFAARPESLPRAVGAAGMFGLSLAAYWLNSKYPLDMHLCYLLAWLLLGLVVWLLASAFLTRRDQLSRKSPPHESVLAKFTRLHAAALCSVPAVWLIFAGYTIVQQNAPAPPAKSPLSDRLKGRNDIAQLALVGDVMMGRGVETAVQSQEGNFDLPMSGVKTYLQQADAAFCNLESPISDLGEPIQKRYTFRSPPAAASALANAGMDLVSLANDHTLDFGPEALADTVRRLGEAGIRHTGLAETGAAQQPVILTLKEVRFGFLAYVDPESDYADPPEYDALAGPKPAKATAEQCAADISALKRDADIIVVSIHWGSEYVERPDRRQMEFGRFLIDSGAHIVAGHHPHVQQDAQWYNGGIIIHSMGNFVFDQWSKPAARLSRLYRAYCDKSGVVGLEFLPLDKEKAAWTLFPTSQSFVEVPVVPTLRRMPMKRPPAQPR